IADFVGARSGKAPTVAATVGLIAIIGTIPYIALQLKAVSSSLSTILVHIGPASGAMQPVLGDIAFYVAVAMAIFAVLFGTRHIDATEHQDGLMLAVATESIVKLVAFVAVGVFVTFWMFDGPLALFAQAVDRLRPVHDRGLRRRPFGRDRDGDRGVGRACNHGVQRHRDAARAAAARGPAQRARERRPLPAHGAADGDLRHPVFRLHLLPH